MCVCLDSLKWEWEKKYNNKQKGFPFLSLKSKRTKIVIFFAALLVIAVCGRLDKTININSLRSLCDMIEMTIFSLWFTCYYIPACCVRSLLFSFRSTSGHFMLLFSSLIFTLFAVSHEWQKTYEFSFSLSLSLCFPFTICDQISMYCCVCVCIENSKYMCLDVRDRIFFLFLSLPFFHFYCAGLFVYLLCSTKVSSNRKTHLNTRNEDNKWSDDVCRFYSTNIRITAQR